ncbi:hypothetical protein KF707_20665 [Candidatus Obscuribacterales bacterium]|nr:hypothetical protein [Candidatus Obscuribacterales bacterium]
MNLLARRLKNRRAGAILLLIVAVGFMVLATGFIVICFFMVLSQQGRDSSQTDAHALSFASEINGQDWVGEINNMTGFARELVFTSRQECHRVSRECPQFNALAKQLLDEARLSSMQVEADKRTLLKDIDASLKVSIRNAEQEQKRKRGLALAWFSTEPSQLESVELGFMDGVSSNVIAPAAIPELKAFDIASKSLDEKSGFYNGNINAKLPEPDNDLDFRICSLPACVKTTVSPARLASNDEFRTLLTLQAGKTTDFSKCEQLPSAVRVHSAMNVSTSAGGKTAAGRVRISSTVAAAGGTMKLP